MDRNQNHYKKIAKDNRKKVYPAQSLTGMGQKSSNTFKILFQPSVNWGFSGISTGRVDMFAFISPPWQTGISPRIKKTLVKMVEVFRVVPALVAAPAGEVLWVVSPEVGKLFSDTCRPGPQVSTGENMPVDVSVYLQHSHHHHALDSRKAAPASVGTPMAGLLVVHFFTSARQDIAWL